MSAEGQLDMLAALEQVEAGADDVFMREAQHALDVVISRRVPFTTEDVKALVIAECAEPRVYGALIRSAAMQKRIRKTGERRYAESRTCHNREMTVWVAA